MKTNHNNFLNLSFNLARINLGKTKANPSVGCVVVKKDSVISSGYTSIKGRPHAEFNALNKKITLPMYIVCDACMCLLSCGKFIPPLKEFHSVL